MTTPIVLPTTQEALEIEERHIEARHSRTGVVRLEQQKEERIYSVASDLGSTN
jgi:hypothetical protein